MALICRYLLFNQRFFPDFFVRPILWSAKLFGNWDQNGHPNVAMQHVGSAIFFVHPFVPPWSKAWFFSMLRKNRGASRPKENSQKPKEFQRCFTLRTSPLSSLAFNFSPWKAEEKNQSTLSSKRSGSSLGSESFKWLESFWTMFGLKLDPQNWPFLVLLGHWRLHHLQSPSHGVGQNLREVMLP